MCWERSCDTIESSRPAGVYCCFQSQEWTFNFNLIDVAFTVNLKCPPASNKQPKLTKAPWVISIAISLSTRSMRYTVTPEVEIYRKAVEYKGSNSSDFDYAYFIQRTETCLQVLLNQSSVIHTKSGCNKEKRLTRLCVPADYLVLESQRGTQSTSPHRRSNCIFHTSCLHPYH